MHPIAFDTETALIAQGLQAPPLVCLSIAHEDGHELVHRVEAREWMINLLESDRVLIGHNVAFDFGVFAATFPELLPAIFEKYERGEVTDTLIRQKLIDIGTNAGPPAARPYSLQVLARRHLGVELDKDTWRLRYGELYDVPITWWPEGAKHYAITDAITTLDLAREQSAHHEYFLADQFRQTRAAWWLHLMRCWGLRTDPEAVERLAASMQDEHDRLLALLQEKGIVRANGSRDTKAAAAHMRQVCAEQDRALVLTTTSRVALGADQCKATADPTLIAYSEISSLKKRIGTEIKTLKRGLIQAWFNSLLETGRTSSRPNVQNLPRKGGIRECYVPRPGKVFAAADYGRFELHTVSQVLISQLGVPSKLADALNDGFDPHLEIASKIVGCSYEEAAERIHEDEIDRARQVGKVANFGFPGGLGATRFVDFARSNYGVAVTEPEARKLKTAWLEAWPEFASYFAWIGQQCSAGKATIEQAFVQRYRGGCSFTEACNTLFQGLASDAAKAAGFLIAKACYVDTTSPLYGGRPVNFIHDEFIVEVDDDEHASAAAIELARLMVEGAAPFLPDVPPTADPYLMRRWSKNAKPIFEGDQLVPWDGVAA